MPEPAGVAEAALHRRLVGVDPGRTTSVACAVYKAEAEAHLRDPNVEHK